MQLNQYKLQSEIGKVRSWSLFVAGDCMHTRTYGWKVCASPRGLTGQAFLKPAFVFFGAFMFVCLPCWFEQVLFKVEVEPLPLASALVSLPSGGG